MASAWLSVVPSNPSSPAVSWATVILAATVLETWALRNKRTEATLSSLTRRTFCVHNPLGRAAFVLSWTALTCWFVPHVCHKEIRVQAKP